MALCSRSQSRWRSRSLAMILNDCQRRSITGRITQIGDVEDYLQTLFFVTIGFESYGLGIRSFKDRIL